MTKKLDPRIRREIPKVVASKGQDSGGKVGKKGKATLTVVAAPLSSPTTEAPAKSNDQPAPTLTLAKELQDAFDWFNTALFAGQLPKCMLRVERLKKYKGYFKPKQWGTDKKDDGTHEIVLDPALFRSRDLKDTLSTLVHEMVHLQDEANGTAPKKAYHGKSWVTLMNAIDLTPVIMNAKMVPTGKETGANSTHEIVKGGKFDLACDKLLQSGFVLSWSAVIEPEKEKGRKKKAGAKAKFCCSECENAAWGKPSLKIACGDCSDGDALVFMVCEDADQYEDADA